MIVEQRGRDFWKFRCKSLHEAVERGLAGIGVDRILLQRALKYDVKTVMVVMEEIGRIFLAPIDDFFDRELVRNRPNWQGRSTCVLYYTRFHKRYLGPNLRKRRRKTKPTPSPLAHKSASR